MAALSIFITSIPSTVAQLTQTPTTTQPPTPTPSPTSDYTPWPTSDFTPWPTSERCDSETPCPDTHYCDTWGSCISCEPLASAGPYGCDNELYDRGKESCLDACSASWSTCSDGTSCSDDAFCTHQLVKFACDPVTEECTSESTGHCFGCDRINDPLACFGVKDDNDSFFTPKGQDSCASSCFQECSGDATCPDGTFCNYQKGSTGHCSGCSLFEDGSECLAENDNPLTNQGKESCASACFGCSASEPCQDGWFCDYQFGDTGYCTTCDKVDGDPMRCTSSSVVPDSGGILGQESCLDSCLDVCSSDFPCGDESFFCDFQVGDEGGYCSFCGNTVRGNPFQCADRNIVSSFGEDSCLETCFDGCSSDAPCRDYGSFCTSTSDGYCMDCEELRESPIETLSPEACLALDIPQESQATCLSSCFTQCSPEDFFCNCIDIIGTGETGYCEKPGVFAGRYEGVGCKFCPDVTPSQVQSTVVPQEPTAPQTEDESTGGGDDQENPTDVQQEPTSPQTKDENTAGGEEGDQKSPTSSPNVIEAINANSCEFCPNNDMLYPERQIRIFDNIQCLNMTTWAPTFLTANTRDCQLAETSQHICGCSGRSSSYAGANTHTKQVVLAWLPRCMALLSIAGSSIIIADIAGNKKRRSKTFGQLMILLSSFDLLASIAYAFTTLPTPAEDYVYGSRGNAKSCTAQGFFISMGSVACHTNVSLAFYYLLMLKMGWSENKIKRKARLWLFAVPVFIGLVFSFAGIPFYDNVVLWCSNASNFWPDIPVAVAIGIATIVMGVICVHVYREEKASAKWRGTGGRQKKSSMASMVAWQSVWYLAAFYMVWPPYLALQYLWASGRVYDNYGFILFAGTLVPMQGFWNCITYMRPRLQNRTGRDKEGLWSRHMYPCLRSLSSTLSSTLSGIAWTSSSSDTRAGGKSTDNCTDEENAPSGIAPELAGEENTIARGDEKGGESSKTESSDPADITDHVSLFCSEGAESDSETRS